MLNYYPQLTLDELDRLPVDRFLFLMVGMLDNIAPAATEPTAERISRLTREAHAKAVGGLRRRSGI